MNAPIVSARDRVKSITELADITAKARASGKTVVLAHGVFDLLHMGHVRHLEAARKLGDMLIVTVTADKFVNKGPGRPAFPQLMRSEMLAALDYVDYAGVNEAATAETLLDVVRPSVYVKGSDYADDADDVTGKIRAEREIVEKHGGRVVFTDEITYSSSTLLNTHFNLHNPETRDFLSELRKNGGAERALDLLERAENLNVLFIGETIIDEYDYVEALGKSAKENIIATKYLQKEVFAGGVIAAANHAAGICKRVEVVTCLGSNDSYETETRNSVRPNVDLSIFYHQDRPTVRKRRFVEEGHLRKLFEVYYMDDRPISDIRSAEICDYLENKVDTYDVVVACDFGHGMMSAPIRDLIQQKARFLAINAQTNAGNFGYNMVSKYSRGDFVCIDEKEARLAVRDRNSDLGEVVSKEIPNLVDCDRVSVTMGNRGSLNWSKVGGLITVPAFSQNPVDTMGAGDTYLAVAALMHAVGGSPDEASFIGHIAAGIKVGVVGHRQSVGAGELKKSIISLLK